MLILGLDLETNGLDTDTCEILEVGAVLYDWERKRPIDLFNCLVADEDTILGDRDPTNDESVRVNGITVEDLRLGGITVQEAIVTLEHMVGYCDAVMTQNGEKFDIPILQRFTSCFDEHTRIDTRMDIQFPDWVKSKVLNHMAADHGFLNPFQHRAVFDVMTMLEIASRYDIKSMLSYASTPVVRVRTQDKPPYEWKTDELKPLGFLWGPSRELGKFWFKDCRELEAGLLFEEWGRVGSPWADRLRIAEAT